MDNHDYSVTEQQKRVLQALREAPQSTFSLRSQFMSHDASARERAGLDPVQDMDVLGRAVEAEEGEHGHRGAGDRQAPGHAARRDERCDGQPASAGTTVKCDQA